MKMLQRYKCLVFAARFGVLRTALPLVLLGLLSAQTSRAQSSPNSPLVVHEWGTFTSIAGHDGNALEWRPISTKSDLPTFVEHHPIADLKGGLRGTVRMETPVIYFYSPRQITVAASVSLAAGLITEWFPHASQVRPRIASPIMLDPQNAGSISWDAVTVSPAANANFPHESSPSHYYAARETSASTVAVQTSAGHQVEKFLFYRGVSLFTPPLSAKVLGSSAPRFFSSNGGAIRSAIGSRHLRGPRAWMRPQPAARSILFTLILKTSLSHKACIATRLTRCWNPGGTRGL